jgi:exodeoxyribonuclease-3
LKLLTSSGPVRVVGLYVPSRDLSQEKIDGKRGFLEAIESELMNSSFPTIVGGDYNIVSRNHSPKVPQFDFEYSFLEKLEGSGYIDAGLQLAKTPHDHTWFGRTGDRYRYDYFHVRGVDFQAGSQCHYLHETRDSKLSDHSGLSLSLNGAEFLEVEPEAITESDQASLF